MKKILFLFLSIFMIGSLSACSNDNSNTNTSNPSSNNQCAIKHEVELNMSNYLDYIEVYDSLDQLHGGVQQVFLSFKGALDHAVYDDVIITYQVNGEDSTRTVKLNKGGNGITVKTHYKTTVVDISGKVTYII